MKSVSTIFPVFFLTGAMLAGHVQAQVSTAERIALIDLYDATGGEQWRLNEGWLGEPGTECNWRGVFCAFPQGSEPFVRMLGLANNGLTGELPESIGALRHLEILSLSMNELYGSIPPTLGDLDRLENVNLDRNRLSGLIPAELLNAPGRLYLSENLLEGFAPGGMDSVGQRQVVNLRNNRITSMPPQSWSVNSGITWLNLSNNRITGVADLAGLAWPGLRVLDLSGNAITEVSGLAADVLIDLQQLYLSDNAMEHWPLMPEAMPMLNRLELANNGLDGAVPEHLGERENLKYLLLSGNQLDSGVPQLLAMPDLYWLDMSDNPLGSLPAELAAPLAPIAVLKLASAGLEGEIPQWFTELTLFELDLSDNRLSGTIDRVVAALDPEANVVRLKLNDNGFTGPIPEALAQFDFRGQAADLCWNQFDEPIDPGILVAGSDLASLPLCNNRMRRDIDVSISGSWYAPEHSGQGYSVMMLADGAVIAYWWGYPEYFVPGEQMWLLNMALPSGSTARMDGFSFPWPGDFGHGQAERGRVIDVRNGAALRFDALDDGRLQAYFSVPAMWGYLSYQPLDRSAQSGQGGMDSSPQLTPVPPPVSDRRDLVRLTQLAGTTCDNQHPGQEISGLWFDLARSGEGFVVEVIGNQRALAYWFTYTPDDHGNQAWLIGDGFFDGSTLIIDNVLQPVGGGFGAQFDPDAVERVHWGELRLEFFDEDSGHVYWNSVFDDYGSGDYPLQRLARAKLADCTSD